MGRETVVSPAPPGAGRTEDWASPPPAVSFFAGVTAGIWSRIQYRQISNYAQWVNTNTGTGGTFATEVYNGAPCYNFSASVGTVPGTGQAMRTIEPSIVPIFAACVPGVMNGGPAQALQVVRMYCNLALPGVPLSDQDYGFECLFTNGTGAVSSIIHDNAPGFGWIRRASGAVSFIVNGGSGLSFHDIANPSGFDVTQLNSYEFMIIQGTPTAATQLQAKINGTKFFTFTWDVGTILPTFNAAYGQAMVEWINYAGNNIQSHMQATRWIAAPTFQDTL